MKKEGDPYWWKVLSNYMRFELAVVVILAIVAVILGLIKYLFFLKDINLQKSYFR